jgi:predicted transcriptional regulator
MFEKIPPRERELVDIFYRAGESTVAELRDRLADPLSASALRTMLVRLEAKGLVQRRQTAAGWLYSPTVPQDAAKESMLQHVVRVFFDGSAASAASALLGMSDSLDAQALDELERLVAAARKRRSEP